LNARIELLYLQTNDLIQTYDKIHTCVVVLELHKNVARPRTPVENIGVVLSSPANDRSKNIAVANANRRNAELEQAARHRKCKNPFVLNLYLGITVIDEE